MEVEDAPCRSQQSNPVFCMILGCLAGSGFGFKGVELGRRRRGLPSTALQTHRPECANPESGWGRVLQYQLGCM